MPEERLLIRKECHELAIYDLGGVGKTQLALAFCYTVKVKYPDYSIFWLSALSIAQFRQGYVKIAKKCTVGTGTNEDELIKIVQEYLSNEATSKWLSVIDNSDDKNILFEDENSILDILPQSAAGITLFTTRNKDIAVDVAHGNILSLESMDLTEAKIFLKKALKDDDSAQDDAIVEDLLEELMCLPLVIAQASSYIAKTSMKISKYLQLVRDTEEDMIKLLSRDFRGNRREKESRNAVALTWLVLFDLIKRDEPDAADVLCFLAFLENRMIPLSILPISGSKGEMAHAIGALIGFSFLSEQRDGNEIYDMHRLIHRAVKIWMQRENIDDVWRMKVVSHLAKIFPSYHWENRNLWQLYTPHAIRVLQDTQRIDTKERAALSMSLGLCLEQDGRTADAIQWISECVSWNEQHLFEDDPDCLSAQSELAAVYLLNGQIKEALKMLEKVVPLEARVLTEEDPSRLRSQHSLAEAYKFNGQIKDAVTILETNLKIRTRVLAGDHPDLLLSQHALARAYQLDG